jgi:uncharacterized membrane protein
MVNPFDLKAAFLATHAQYIVFIHFPIALFISAVAFDLMAQWTKSVAWRMRHITAAPRTCCVSSGPIWLVWWIHFAVRRRTAVLPSYRLALEFLGVGLVALTGHPGWPSKGRKRAWLDAPMGHPAD